MHVFILGVLHHMYYHKGFLHDAAAVKLHGWGTHTFTSLIPKLSTPLRSYFFGEQG